MHTYINYIITPILAIILVLVLTPVIRKIALKINLTDQPNIRKVHQYPVPLVGGILIFMATFLAFLAQLPLIADRKTIYTLSVGSVILLITGVVDDKIDVKASYKLAIQIAVASFVYSSGIHIDSLYGLFGIYTISGYVQWSLTMIVIVGVINAFNLTDGIDGLAGSLVLLGLLVYSLLAIKMGKYDLLMLFLTLSGALIGFLRNNLSKTTKIFMGDAGSLSLGFIMVVSGMLLLQTAETQSNHSIIVATVIGVLALPVIDSLRVYRGRLKAGYSPFRADRTHLHHLVLSMGFNPIKATAFIVIIAVCIILLTIMLGTYISLTYTLIALILLFSILSSALGLNHDVSVWRAKIKKLEAF